MNNQQNRKKSGCIYFVNCASSVAFDLVARINQVNRRQRSVLADVIECSNSLCMHIKQSVLIVKCYSAP